MAHDQVTVSGPRGFGNELRLLERTLLSRLAVLRQEVVARAGIRGLHDGGIERDVLFDAAATPGGPGEQQKGGLGRARSEKTRQTTRHGCENAEQLAGGPASGQTHVQVSRAGRQISVEHRRRHKPPVEQRREPAPRTPIAKLREDERHVFVLASEAPTRAQRAIERFIDETWDLGFIGHVEPGIEVGLERKFTQQRQAKGIDGADRDVVGPVAQLAPPRRRKLAAGRRRAQRGDDPLTHLGGRLAREGDRKDVRWVDTGTEQVDIAVDQHARLAGARRRLERDVVARINGARASFPVTRVDA